ncbi:hypothetical protein Goari_026919, partial [Gossypium aridum]|nr:hypothetical protein [Gossypium aridum]
MLRRLEDRVSSTKLVPGVEDQLCWVHDSNGEFIVMKCYELLIIDGGDDINFAFDKIWKLKVPSRVQNFLWMLTIDRIPTKEFLVKRGVKLQNISISCPWCERVPERADHFFFKCKFIEGFWYRIFNWWEDEWESVEGFAEFYSLCYNMKLKDDDHGNFDFSIKDESIAVDKFNVYGIANEDSAGCGGVLRDTEGVARALFSSLIAANDVDSTEAGAVLLALECVNKSMRPWSLQSTFVDIERKIEKVGSVVFSMEEKKGNEMASTLAIGDIIVETCLKLG